MLTTFIRSNAWFSCIDGVAGIMPIITCPSCNSTNTRFCHDQGFVENTHFCRKTGFIANTRLFGFVWCRLLRRHLGFDSDFAHISGLKVGGWQHWLMLKIVQVHVRMHHICAISFFCNKMLNELRIVQYASMSTCQVLQRPHPPTHNCLSAQNSQLWQNRVLKKLQRQGSGKKGGGGRVDAPSETIKQGWSSNQEAEWMESVWLCYLLYTYK